MTGAEVIALRKALRCTQKDLALRLDVEVSIVQGWENGALFPTLRHVKMLEGMGIHHGGTEARRQRSEDGKTGTEEWARALGDAEFMAALRKALANPELRAKIVKIAARFKDPLQK